MQNIIITIIIMAIIFAYILCNFLDCARRNNGRSFNVSYFFDVHSLRCLKFSYILIFFILLSVLYKSNDNTSFWIYSFTYLALLLSFCMDIQYMIIPNASLYIILGAGIVNLFINYSMEAVISSIIGLIIGYLILYVIDYIFKKITNKTGFGFGDVKLLSALGFLFGYKCVLVIFFMSILICGVFCIFYSIYNAIKKNRKEYIAFGPFMVISAFIVTIIPYTRIIEMYFNLIDNIMTRLI